VRLERSKPLSLHMEDGQSVSLHSVDLERDMDASYLRGLVGADGVPLTLPSGTRVTLLSGESVLFVGITQPDGSVKDFLSCSAEEGEFEDL